MSDASPARRKIILGCLAAGLFALAGLIFSYSGASAQYPETYRVNGVCLACKQEGRLEPKTAETRPYECPHCSERTFYPWYFCSDCKMKFVPDLVKNPGGGKPHGLPPVPACSECGSIHVGTYFPSDPEQVATGTAELPELP